jgi:exodeoxyribonuclease-3
MPTNLSVATINVNGVRAAFKKGLAEWVVEHSPDVIALQEVRAETTDLIEIFQAIQDLQKDGTKWHILHDSASAKGRAGVAIISKMPAVASRTTLGTKTFDSAGRWLEVDFKIKTKTVTVISTYVHSGEVDTPKQVEKYKFLDAMTKRMAELRKEDGLVVVVGDLNVGHTELDIKNWKGNIKNAGFLPEERAYFDTWMHKQGWVDLGRAAHPDAPGPYTWVFKRYRAIKRRDSQQRVGNLYFW